MMRLTMSVAAIAMAAGGASAQCSSAKSTQDVHDTAKITQVSMGGEKDIVATAMASGKFNTLAAALKAAGLVETLQGKGPFTVFAPTDEAFAALPKGTVETLLKPENKAQLTAILTYHVVHAEVLAKDVRTGSVATVNGQRVDLNADGGSVTIDSATVTATDVLATNGVIHVIDRVMMPSEKSVVQTAVDAGQFKTLALLLEKAGLVDALSGKGDFTVFAPTDEAFAKLPKETVESLLKPENKGTLADILKYHVLTSRVFSDAAAKGATAKTLEGSTLTTKGEYSTVMVNNAKVVKADIDASNGVIHVIDTVIMPPARGSKPGK
jgi:uncharacterized surface protein with fasciclin (FAS1) repeats